MRGKSSTPAWRSADRYIVEWDDGKALCYATDKTTGKPVANAEGKVVRISDPVTAAAWCNAMSDWDREHPAS